VLAGVPSRTAQDAAVYRAAHQLVDSPPVLVDALALKIIGEKAEGKLRAGLERRATARAGSMRAFIAVRSRYAEDCFATAYRRGVRQYVVLGAGLDTYAYRCTLDGVRMFEVDHPSTQDWKRERLAQAGIAIPAGVVYAPVDFEHEALREGLARAQLDLSRSAFFAWLGVTPYLTPEAIASTLRFVAGDMAAGSEIVFDFAAPPGDDPRARAARAAFAARVEAKGEPFVSEFAPSALAGTLRGLGFAQVEVARHVALQARYLAERKDGLRLGGGQLMRVRV